MAGILRERPHGEYRLASRSSGEEEGASEGVVEADAPPSRLGQLGPVAKE